MTAGDCKIYYLKLAGIQIWGIENNQIKNYTNIFHSNEKGEILCLTYHSGCKYLFAGYKNGNVAAWMLQGNKFEELGLTQMHNDVLLLFIFLVNK